MENLRVGCAIATRAALGLAVLLLGEVGRAATFTPGNIIVYRVGDGLGPLANTGNAVFLDEFTTNGDPVQSIALPTVASGSNSPLVASGTAASEGMLTLSTDGRFILLTGYATTLPAATSLSASSAAEIPRIVGRVDADGNIDTSTVLTDFSDGNNPRSAASTDGVSLWIGGADGGVRYTTLGGTSSVRLSTDSKNIRQVSIFDGQLYMSSQKTDLRVATVGTGLPTTSGQSIVNLPDYPVTGNPDAFFFADLDGSPGLDTLYVADDTTDDGEIQKYSLVDGSWLASGVITAPYVHGLTGVVTGRSVTLYATGNGLMGTSGTLYTYTDRSGYDGLVSDLATTLVTAFADQAFRGVALAPEAGAGPTSTPTRPLATSTPTRPPATPTPTRRLITPTPRFGDCVGDCGGIGIVRVADLIQMLNIALGNQPFSACMPGDADGNGQIDVIDLVAGVNSVLNGCGRQ
jgi:hypothetical protein